MTCAMRLSVVVAALHRLGLRDHLDVCISHTPCPAPFEPLTRVGLRGAPRVGIVPRRDRHFRTKTTVPPSISFENVDLDGVVRTRVVRTRPAGGGSALSGTDESALVGQDDGLRAVVQPELAEYPADVDAHRALGDGQVPGDAVVGKPAGEHEEHLALA